MPTYRAYRLNPRRRIVTGQWLNAESDAAAIAQAEKLCDEATDGVELWQAARLVTDLDCDDDDAS